MPAGGGRGWVLATTTPGRRCAIVDARSARQGDHQSWWHHRPGPAKKGTHMRVGHDTKRTPAMTSGLLRRPLVALVALATVGVLAAGCGSSSSSGGSGSGGGLYGGSSAPTTAPSAVATVSATSTSLGTILVDGSGRTLY